MARLVGRSASSGRDNAAEVTDAGALKVDIGSATLSVTADGVEINNDIGNPIPVADANSSLTVDGKAYRSTVSFNRPDNSTAYTALDVVGSGTSAIHTLSTIGPSGGFVLIQSMALFIANTSVPAGMSAFRVHLYSSSPTAILDNAAFDLVSGDRAAYMGYVDLPAPQDLGSTIYAQVDYPGRLIKLAAASTSLFAQIQTIGAYTPAALTTYELRMSTLEAGL